MKTLLLLPLLVTLSFATFTPQWKSCGDVSDSWLPTSVTFEKEPQVDQTNTIHVCGRVQEEIMTSRYIADFKAASQTFEFKSTRNLTPQITFPGEDFCFDHTIILPFFAKGASTVSFNLEDFYWENVGCVILDLLL